MSGEHVALCPVTEELVSHLLALAELDLTDDDAVEARMREAGRPDWSRAVRGPAYEDAPFPDGEEMRALLTT
ncbi:hypothetical protein ACWGBH_23000 [Streptomyces massasporeus]